MKKTVKGILATSVALAAGCSLVACKKDNPTTDNPGDKEELKYSVTYDACGHGTAPSSASNLTALPSTLPELSETGYKFEGWYLDSNYTTKATPGAAISANTTLYAKWSVEVATKFSVTYNVNGHGEAQAELTNVDKLPDTLPNLTADGWKFEGWYTDAALTTKAVAGASITANTTLYAKWVEKTAFDIISESQDAIIAEDFNSMVETDKLTDWSGTWGTKGIYSYLNSKTNVTADNTTNYVKLGNGSAELIDTTDAGTQLCVDFGETLELGKVKGYVEVTTKGSGNSWTFVQFIGTNAEKSNTEVFGLRTDADLIKYRLNAGSATAALNAVSLADTTYKINFEFDLASHKVTMTINGVAFVTDLETEIKGLQGIRFVSSDNGSKTSSIDNLAVAFEEPSTDVYKSGMLAEVDAKVAAMALDTNYITKKTEIEDYVSAKKALINAATTSAEIKEIYEAVVAYLEAALSDAEIATITEKVEYISECIALLPATDASSTTILTYASSISQVRELVDALTDVEKTYLNAADITKLEALEELVIQYESQVTPLQRVEAKVNEYKALFSSYVKEYFTEGYTINAAEVAAEVQALNDDLDKILADADGVVTDENVDSYINSETGIIKAKTEAHVLLLMAIDSDLDVTIDNKISSLDEIYNSDKASYTEAYNLAAYTAAYEALKTAISSCETIAEVNAITFDSMTSIRNDEDQIAYNNLPTYTVNELANTVNTEAFTSYAAVDKLSDTVYGPFSVKKGTASKMKMKAGYLDLFSGNTIEFTVKNDGATFMIAYNSNNTGRKVILTNSNSSITPVSKFCANLLQSTSDSKGSYTFNGTKYELEVSAKGWLVFDNLAAGTYTVTFDTEEDGKTPGAVDQAEQKIEYLKLFDQETKDVEKKVLALDASFTGSTVADITSSMSVVANIEGQTEPKTLASTEYTLEFYNSSDEVINDGDVSYVIVKYTKDTKVVSVKKTVAEMTSASYQTGTYTYSNGVVLFEDKDGNVTIC
ncbi:MAG: InlB B-repeat-containing protein [Anaeroplasmataceae bacterium]